VRIALTKTENPEKHKFYIDWLKGNDDIEIITVSADENDPDDIKKCDALVLSGGIDIHPEFYGGLLDYTKAPAKWKKERDVFEIAAFRLAIDQSIPVLGICRGLQLINVALKGTLIQDLGNNLDPIHEGNPDKCHIVTVGPETILYDITKESVKTNSAHHQAIEQLGEGLIINCNADDGTAEGIEWSNKNTQPFLLGVQWHPERMFRFNLENSPASKGIRERFIEEVKKSEAARNENH
jgi:putative glutamine amidotransferase